MLPWYGLLPIKFGALEILCHICHTKCMRLLHIIVTSDANAEVFNHPIWHPGNPFYGSGYLAAPWQKLGYLGIPGWDCAVIFGRFWHLSKALGNHYGGFFVVTMNDWLPWKKKKRMCTDLIINQASNWVLFLVVFTICTQTGHFGATLWAFLPCPQAYQTYLATLSVELLLHMWTHKNNYFNLVTHLA